MSTVDPVPALEGKCVTGGRLNIGRALGAPVAETMAFVSTDVPLNIPDRSTRTSSLVVDASATIQSLSVKVNISHPADQDMDVLLISPLGTRVELFTDVGGRGDDFSGTVLHQAASLSITEGSAPFVGAYRPEGDLGALVGENIHGTWTLEVTDDKARNTGTLNSWSIKADVGPFVNSPPVAVNDSYSTSQDTNLNVSVPGVLANDTDADPGDTLSAVLVTDVSSGSLSLNSNGSFGYVPAPGFFGSDSFT